MVEIILLSVAVLVLVLSAFFLARSKRSHSVDNDIPSTYADTREPRTKPFIRQRRLSRSLDKYDKYDEKDASPFDNRYDELVFLLKNGDIDEAEYNKEIKNIMN